MKTNWSFESHAVRHPSAAFVRLELMPVPPGLERTAHLLVDKVSRSIELGDSRCHVEDQSEVPAPSSDLFAERDHPGGDSTDGLLS